jgi:hypothetical protein
MGPEAASRSIWGNISADDPLRPSAIRCKSRLSLGSEVGLRAITIVIWRVIGGVFLIYAVTLAIVQFGAVTGAFGQIMDDESLYTSKILFSIFLWPAVCAVAGIVVILASRLLADIVLRGLDSNGSQ